jgi:hypothetical protein
MGRVWDENRNLCCHTHLDTSVSRTWVDSVSGGCDKPIHSCTCVSEEGGDGEDTDSEAQSLLSYTLGYVSLTDLYRFCQWGL